MSTVFSPAYASNVMNVNKETLPANIQSQIFPSPQGSTQVSVLMDRKQSDKKKGRMEEPVQPKGGCCSSCRQ